MSHSYKRILEEFCSSFAKGNGRAQQIKLNIELGLNMKKDVSLNWPAIPSDLHSEFHLDMSQGLVLVLLSDDFLHTPLMTTSDLDEAVLDWQANC